MTDDNRDYLPQRAVRAIEEPAATDGRLTAFRARAKRFALPAVLALTVTSGLAFTGLAPQGGETQQLTAAPAPAVLAERDVAQVSRDFDRVMAEVAETPAADAEGALEAQPLTGFTAAPKPEPKPAAAQSTERRYATAPLNVRAEASASSARIGSVARGATVQVTGRTSNGFSQVNHNDRTGWVSSDYLSKNAPAASNPSSSADRSGSSSSRASSSSSSSRAASSAPARSSAAPARSSGGSGGSSGGSCTALPGLQPRTAAVHQALCANFPAITSYGGVRPDWDVEHPSGRAIDAMTTNQATGDAVANWARANAAQYGITEVIWNQRIWTTQRASEGWRMMSDRGSATANHRDHVHISVR